MHEITRQECAIDAHSAPESAAQFIALMFVLSPLKRFTENRQYKTMDLVLSVFPAKRSPSLIRASDPREPVVSEGVAWRLSRTAPWLRTGARCLCQHVPPLHQLCLRDQGFNSKPLASSLARLTGLPVQIHR